MANASAHDWPKVVDAVCKWLASGRTIRDFCRQEGNPDKTSLYEYLNEAGDEVEGRIVRARARGCDDLAEEAFDILDECATDVEKAQACKVRFDGRMRLLSKWNSGRYGDKAQVEHSGGVSIHVVTGVPDVTGNAE
jgi:hypothetical protein